MMRPLIKCSLLVPHPSEPLLLPKVCRGPAPPPIPFSPPNTVSDIPLFHLHPFLLCRDCALPVSFRHTTLEASHMPAKSRSPAPGRRSGAPSGGGTSTSMKRRQAEELIELPPLTSMPDGESEFFVGGWSSLGGVADSLSVITRQLNSKGASTPSADSTTSMLPLEVEEAYVAGASALVGVAVRAERTTLRRLLALEDAATKGINPPPPSKAKGWEGEDNAGEDGEGAQEGAQVHHVLVLPSATRSEEPLESDGVRIALLTHGLNITGLLPTQTADNANAFEIRTEVAGKRSSGNAAGLTEDEEGVNDEVAEEEDPEDGDGVAIDKGAYTVKFRSADAAVGGGEEEDEEEPEEELGEEADNENGDGAGVEQDEAVAFVLAAKRSVLRRMKARGEGRSAVAAAASGLKLPPVTRRAHVVDPTNVVEVVGPIAFVGLKPSVSVKPAEVTQEAIYAAAGLASPSAAAGGKVKRRTDEERAREAAAEQKLIEEAAANAKEEEARLSQYADPARWPTVTVSRLAFVASPNIVTSTPLVAVRNAHIHFVGCHFTGTASVGSSTGGPVGNLVAVAAHCRVTFTRCTFVAPHSSAVYAFPSSVVTVNQCVFSADQQPIKFFAASAAGLTSLEGRIFAPTSSTNAAAPSAPQQTVGIHADCAKVSVRGSHFEGLSVGVLMRGAYKAPKTNGDEEADGQQHGIAPEPNEEGHRVVRPKPPHSTVAENSFIGNATAMCFVDARRTAANKNSCVDSSGYDVQCMGPRCTPQILRCNLKGRVYIGEGSAPFLHSNILASVPIDHNNKSSLYSSTY